MSVSIGETFIPVLTYANLPVNGISGRIYVTLNDGKTWSWYGAGYAPFSNVHARGAGINNVNVGESALQSASLSGNYNTAVGANALRDNTSGSNNTAVGADALRDATTALGNTAVGLNVLRKSTGQYNTAVGVSSMEDCTSGDSNTAVGASTLPNVVGGDFNTAVGASAGLAITSGNSNVAVGASALKANQTATQNTAIGGNALLNATAGNNVAVGHNAGDAVTSGVSNTIIGQGADVDTGAREGCIVIGQGAVSPATNHTLSIKAANLTTANNFASPTNVYLRIWLNGVEHRILASKA